MQYRNKSVKHQSKWFAIALFLSIQIADATVVSHDGGLYGTTLYGEEPALHSFSLEFLNGDHHIAWITAGGVSYGSSIPNLNSFLLNLSDSDYGPTRSESSDPARKIAEFWHAGLGLERRIASQSGCTGSCTIRMPTLNDDQVFILSGFTFISNGDNHHILELKIDPQPMDGRIEVFYGDNAGDDNYTVDIVYFVAQKWMPEIRRNPYFLGPFQESMAFNGSGMVARRNGKALLSGFRLRFNNGDHHLRAVEVNLGMQGRGNRIRARFGDQGMEDPVSGWVRYILALPYIY